MLITSWKRRLAALAVPLAFAVLALALPTGNADADVGTLTWSSSSVNYHRTGSGWNGVSNSIINGILFADNEWRNDTLWDPTIITGSSNNDIAWGEKPPSSPAWAGCNPTGTTLAVECTKKLTGTNTISESDISFNSNPTNFTWTGARAQGVATHEMGHSGGLEHSASPCGITDRDRLTMCSGSSETNAHWKASLEQKDVDDADTMYAP